MVELVKDSGTALHPYKAIERDAAGRFAYFRLEASPSAPWPWYPCTPDRMLQEPDGSAVTLTFGLERILLKGEELGEIPRALAAGNCLALVAYAPDWHSPPAKGEAVIRSIEFFKITPTPRRAGRPGRMSEEQQQPHGIG